MKKVQLDLLINALQFSAKRALKLKLKGFPSPYYCSFLLRDTQQHYTWARLGATFCSYQNAARSVFCDIRVGSCQYDQTYEGGLKDNNKDARSYPYLRMPIEGPASPSDTAALKDALWKVSELRFKEALEEYSKKGSERITHVDAGESFPSFRNLPPLKSIEAPSFSPVKIHQWEKYCREASQLALSWKNLSDSWVSFDAKIGTKIFVSTENRVIVQPIQLFSLRVQLYMLGSDGIDLRQGSTLNVAALDELPSLEQLKSEMQRKYEKLLTLAKAKKLYSFSGPVLLYPKPAGILFHESIGHRLEGSRLLTQNDGNTFKGQEGKEVLPHSLSFVDDPTLRTFKGKRCTGSYDYDDEGTPAQPAKLVEGGILKGFLTTRAPVSKKRNKPNGHARSAYHERPMSRMAVSIISGPHGKSIEQLRKLLLKEIRRQKKPYGLIVYDASGGETATSSYDFQAFSGDVSCAALVYPDGKEEIIRGINFVGTPLQALSNITAIGKELELCNAFCGAESGSVPVSTISPAVLLSNLELQAKEEEHTRPFLLPPP